MADPLPADALALVRELLITHGGGFLRNVIWQPGLTCLLCAGIPGNDFPTCYNCYDWRHRLDLSDRLGFVSYAVDGTQSAQVMYGYKAPQPSEANRRVVALMHHHALLRHWSCLTSAQHGPPTNWATVPSLGGRSGVHPLHVLAGSLLEPRLGAAVDLQAAPGAQLVRDLRPQNFVAAVPSGAHVLLVEDTWVGGGRVQSAAAALKVGGAAAVTTVVLARWLVPSRGRTSELLPIIRDQAFDPDRCPFTGEPC